MKKIPLAAVPNQKLTTQLDGNQWDITVTRTANGTAISVDVNGVTIASGVRPVAQQTVFFSPLMAKFGNLVFDCEDGACYPDYNLFGTTHNLYFLTTSEEATL